MSKFPEVLPLCNQNHLFSAKQGEITFYVEESVESYYVIRGTLSWYYNISSFSCEILVCNKLWEENNF